MKQTTTDIMGMPITVEITDKRVDSTIFQEVFNHFRTIDNTYSTYKPSSEISRINNGLPKRQWSSEVKHILELCEQTKRETRGYFNIEHQGKIDPSGLVKGWAIQQAAALIASRGFSNFYVDAGGDIQASGKNKQNQSWRVGIRNPFKRGETVKTLAISGAGVATSGSAIRGLHLYNPHTNEPIEEIVSLTVIGPTIYEADRFATAAFAMGAKAAQFIESLEGFEAYMINPRGIATFTSGLERYAINSL